LVAGADAGLVTTQSPRFFGLVIGGAHPAALAADWLTSAWGRNAGLFADALAAVDGVELLNDVVLNQVLVRFTPPEGTGTDRDAHTHEVVRRVQEEGTCWMSGTTWQGRAAMRISVSNWATTEADVDRSVAAILRCAGLGA
jgi:glutamate/tyrosine decarboxylase-like PLP-dependent enzyme